VPPSASGAVAYSSKHSSGSGGDSRSFRCRSKKYGDDDSTPDVRGLQEHDNGNVIRSEESLELIGEVPDDM
jgi:hypothetical protein